MKRVGFTFVLLLVSLCSIGTNVFGTIADSITPKAVAGQCAFGGTVYDNRTSSPMFFDLAILNGGGDSCAVTLSWTDADGKSQILTVSTPGAALTVATSLGAYDKILWSSQGTASVNFAWYVSQTVNVGSLSGSVPCNSSGTVYENLTQSPINLHLALLAQSYPIMFSWTDASGTPQRVSLAGGVNVSPLPEFQNSEGISTSLKPGGVISWASGSGKICQGGGWQLERTFE